MPKTYLPGPEPQAWHQQGLTVVDKRLITQTFYELLLYKKLKLLTGRFFVKNCNLVLNDLANKDVRWRRYLRIDYDQSEEKWIKFYRYLNWKVR